MGIRQRWVDVVIRMATVLVTLASVGCGSTSPAAPSPVSNPPQYPALVGHWVPAGGTLVFNYRDTGTGDGWRCAVMMDVVSQTGGHFAGSMGGNGTGVSEPACSFSFEFQATIAPDGTLTDFRMSSPFGVGGCTPSSAAMITGALTNGTMNLTFKDRALCRDKSGNPIRDTERTLTMSVTRSSGTSAFGD